MEAVVAANEVGVPAAYGEVIEEDSLSGWRPAVVRSLRGGRLPEFGPLRRSAAPTRQGALHRGLVRGLRSEVSQRLRDAEGDGRRTRVAPRPLRPGPQCRAAVGAELAVIGILMTALGAEGHWCRPSGGSGGNLVGPPVRHCLRFWAVWGTLDQHSRLMVARQPTCDARPGSTTRRERRSARVESLLVPLGVEQCAVADASAGRTDQPALAVRSEVTRSAGVQRGVHRRHGAGDGGVDCRHALGRFDPPSARLRSRQADRGQATNTMSRGLPGRTR